MSPLRIGQQIPWETAFTFEEAINHVASEANDNELFFFEAGETLSDLYTLYSRAQRRIITIWTGKRTSTADAKALLALIETCRVAFDREGRPYVHTADVGELAERGIEAVSECVDGLRRALADGLCELMLRGEERDVRACLWDGRFFRADRTNAVFCRPSCRTAYHRARNTAAQSDRPSDELMGKFLCPDCDEYLGIEKASGIVRQNKWIFVGGIRDGAVCVTCAEKNHPEWSDYIVLMGRAA